MFAVCFEFFFLSVKAIQTSAHGSDPNFVFIVNKDCADNIVWQIWFSGMKPFECFCISIVSVYTHAECTNPDDTIFVFHDSTYIVVTDSRCIRFNVPDPGNDIGFLVQFVDSATQCTDPKNSFIL